MTNIHVRTWGVGAAHNGADQVRTENVRRQCCAERPLSAGPHVVMTAGLPSDMRQGSTTSASGQP